MTERTRIGLTLDATLLFRVENYALQKGLSRGEAMQALLEAGLKSAFDETPSPEMMSALRTLIRSEVSDFALGVADSLDALSKEMEERTSATRQAAIACLLAETAPDGSLHGQRAFEVYERAAIHIAAGAGVSEALAQAKVFEGKE